jgi:hypothetical protein
MQVEVRSPEQDNTSPVGTPARQARRGRVMRFVRRLHMYLGLLVFPWILFFGISGILFNHPHVGRDIASRRVSAEQLSAWTGFRGWSPEVVAQSSLQRINQQDLGSYTLEGDSPAFHGFTLFASPRPDGSKHSLILNIEKGWGGVARFGPSGASHGVPLDGLALPDLPFSVAALETQMQGVSKALAAEGMGPLKAHPKVHPELRFSVRDAQGRKLLVACDLATGTLRARPADRASALPFVELLAQLHTQHHFPMHFGPTFFWALFADLTGLTLVLWALTGLLMWWQMKPSRVIGSIAVALALGLVSWIMVRTADDLTYVEQEAGGP